MSIAAQASVEMDPTKLAVLVEQLCSALDDRRDLVNFEQPARLTSS
jgi:hypothetical protein